MANGGNGQISPKRRFEIFKRDGFTCRYCGQKAPEVTLHIDHVEARANGGNSADDNLVTACSSCNLGKGSTPVKEAPAAVGSPRGLEGLFFYTFQEDGNAGWQGIVTRHRADDWVTVQLFSWLTTLQTDRIVVPLKQLASAVFFETASDARDYAYRHGFGPDPQSIPTEGVR